MDIMRGQIVTVRAYPRERLTRRVVDVQSVMILVTTEEEWHNSVTQKRQPICIGFPTKDVIKVEKPANMPI